MEFESKHSEAKAIIAIAARGEMQKMRDLIRFNPNAVNTKFDGMIPLHGAVTFRRFEMARLLLENGADVDSEMRQTHTTSLLFACQHGNTEMVRLLLSYGANVRGNTSDIRSNPLLDACYRGYHKIMLLLIQHGADVEISFNGRTLLSIACHFGHLEAAKVLLQHGALISFNQCTRNPILDTIITGHENLLRLLLKYSANVNLMLPYGKHMKASSPLFIACDIGNIRFVEILLEAGAHPDMTGPDKSKPITRAIMRRHTGIVALLLQHNAFTGNWRHRMTNLGALHFACWMQNVEAVQMLLDHGDDVNTIGHLCNDLEVTPLHFACCKDNWEILCLLLQHGATATIGRPTPLETCLMRQNFDVAKLLLTHGAKVNEPYMGGYLILHTMCHTNNFEGLCFLLQEGANPNSRDEAGDTPLTICSRHGHINQVQELLKYGADLNDVDGKGNSPIWLAYPHTDVLYVLLRQSPSSWTRLKEYY